MSTKWATLMTGAGVWNLVALTTDHKVMSTLCFLIALSMCVLACVSIFLDKEAS